MALLADDTALTGGDGVYHGALSEDWRIWSPNGGYLMAMALRAVGLASTWSRPVSIMCQFLAIGKFAEVELRVESLRQTRVAEALKVSMVQEGKPLIEALVWAGDVVEGYEHDFTALPEVPGPDELKTLDELVENLQAPYPFFNNFTAKPVNFVPFANRDNQPPYQTDWYKFTLEGEYSDPFVNAGRYLVLLDTFGWTAASKAHKDDPSVMAPTLSLSVDFHRFDECQWLLCQSSAEIADNGLIAVRNQLFGENRSVLASASGTLICRKRPN